VLRVLHWYPNFLGGGGVSGAVLGLAVAQAENGAEVRIAAADEGGGRLYGDLPATAEHLLLKWSPTWRRALGPLVVRGLPRSLREDVAAFAPDLVHAHGEFNPDNLWTTRLEPRAPVVLSPHGAFDPTVFRKTRRRSKAIYARVAAALLYRRLVSFHALSPREEAHVRAVAPGAPAYVLPQGGGPAAAFAASPPPAPGPATRFVFVGRLDVYTKGLDLLIRALAELEPTPAAHLTLVGPDWRGGKAEVEALATRLGARSKLTFAGELQPREVAAIVDDAHCVVLTSRHEGLSLSATEGLVRGKPLILSKETGHASYPEVYTSKHVTLVDPDVADIVRALRAFMSRRDELVDHARDAAPELARFFSWPRIGRAHLDTYERLLRAGG
jgi:glycosyltransferase involved in cell wall biosynthesis